jgi:hypothetical protein
MQKEAGADPLKQISKGYEIALSKPIPSPTLTVMHKLYLTSLASYKKDPYKTCEMAGIDKNHNNPETAALVVVANAMLNLDELITKN